MKDLPNYKEIKTNEGHYTGQYNGARNGYGIMHYVDSSVYTGEWKNNSRHGKGKYIYPDKNEYDGSWENNLPQGYGKFTLVSGINIVLKHRRN